MTDISKIADRIHKLLALARDGGATEAEAELAMSKAQELMAEYNLSMATIEARGGKAEGRVRQKEDENLLYVWKRDLLEKIAKVNFCHLRVVSKTTRAGQSIGGGYEIIGRESNVAASRNMFTYLLATIERLIVEEVGTSPQERYSRWSHSFRVGCSERLKDRLQERHDAKLEAQAKEAREAEARNRHPAAATGNALVVVLKDYEQAEYDLNNDLRFGYEPGTTARRRAEYETKQMEAQRQFDAKLAKVLADNPGINERLAEYLARGWERDRAERQCEKRQERERREYRRWQDRQERRDARTDWGGYNRGATRADSVGLDEQVDKASRKAVR